VRCGVLGLLLVFRCCMGWGWGWGMYDEAQTRGKKLFEGHIDFSDPHLRPVAYLPTYLMLKLYASGPIDHTQRDKIIYGAFHWVRLITVDYD